MTTSDRLPNKLAALKSNLCSAIQGKEEVVDLLIISLLAGGSVLMEDVPGVGKTTLAKALAKSLDVSFQRVQFTPDLLPSDILGASIYNPTTGGFTFRKGPIFCHILLADEINRASPRTQSALLEAMSESQVTIEGTLYPLEAPFLVLATQNPVDFHGTYPLPEAQLDRFLMQLNLGYPDQQTEVDILYAQAQSVPLDLLQPVLTIEEVVRLQETAAAVKVEQSLAHYLVELVHRTRSDSRLKLGVSPRGSLMLFRAVQAAALLAGRNYVLPDDLQRMAPVVLSHRVMLTSKAKYSTTTKQDVILDLLKQVKVPT